MKFTKSEQIVLDIIDGKRHWRDGHRKGMLRPKVNIEHATAKLIARGVIRANSERILERV